MPSPPAGGMLGEPTTRRRRPVKKQTRPSAALLAAVQARPIKSSELTLRKIREKMQVVRDLDAQIATVVDTLERLRSARADLCGGGPKRGELVDLFEQCGVKNLELEPEGNAPGMLFELQDWMNISQSGMTSEAKAGMFSWLRRNKLAPLIKDTFTVELDRGDDKKAAMIEKFLRSKKLPFDQRPSVNSGSLKAEVRRRAKAGQPLSPSDLETLGVTTGRVMSIKPQ